MKLNQKILFIMGIIWICSLSIALLLLQPVLTFFYFVVLLVLSIITYIATYQTFKIFIFNHLKKIKQIIKQQKPNTHLTFNEPNELTALTVRINYLLNLLHTYEEELSAHFLEDTKKTPILTCDNSEEKVPDYLGKMAHYDTLTSLPNQVFFNEILNKTLSHATRYNKILAILLIDINLKNIHDFKKHKIVNKLLKEIVNRTSAILRNSDILARSGSQQLIILLNDIKQAKLAGIIAEKILQAYLEPIIIDETSLAIYANIGISTFPQDGISLEELQEKANLALSKAKLSGKNTYQYFLTDMTSKAKNYVQFDYDLRHALEKHEFILYYQPQFNIVTGKINGVEALVRWSHSEMGILYPQHFIHTMEDNGLIIPLGEWVIYEACRINQSWQKKGHSPITVSVNISPQQFAQDNLVTVIQNALEKTGLDAKYLEIEITEMTVMNDIPNTIQKINELKQLGVKICIDDFGTGYTSINHLKYFTIDTLKIDQNFIKSIPSNPNDIAITTAIIGLAHNLGMKVIAEGVETAEQLQFLMQKNCDFVQGYYLSKPIPEEELLSQYYQTKKHE